MSINNVTGVNSLVQQVKQPEVKEKAPSGKEIKDEDNEKVTLALSGLAALGLAAIAIKCGKKDKAVNIVKDKADDAANAILNGASVTKVKKEATKNLAKVNKDIVKEAISSAHSEKLAKEAVIRQNILKNTTTAKKAPGMVKSLSQGSKKASEEVLQAKAKMAAGYADDAARAASEMKEIARNIPTHKNIKRATYAENKAIRANLEALKVEQKSAALIEETRKKAAQKAANKAAAQASPNYAASMAKMNNNAAKAAGNAIKRDARREVQKPAYKRLLQTLQKHYDAGRTDTAEKLARKALKSDKIVERKAAEDFLASIKVK